MDRNSLEVLDFSDGSFDGNSDRSPEVGFILFLADESNNLFITDFSSVTSREVAKSVLNEELSALAEV